MSEIELKATVETRRHHKTREDEADACLNHTEFGPGASKLVVALLLATVFGVALLQHVVEVRENMAKRAEWRPESGQPEPSLLPEVYTIGTLLPTGKQIADAKGFWGYWSLIPSSESIVKFEDGLKENSVLTRNLLSPAQGFMSGVLGVGNEKAYLGQPGWLFYRPDVDYLTSEGFLEPHVLRARQHALNELQPDPVKGILDTRDQLKARGIELIVMPVPTKPMIEAERLIGDAGKGLVLQNPSYGEFRRRLADAGVPVFDPYDLLVKEQSGGDAYLETDTHWNPTAMGKVASALADTVKQTLPLPTVADPGYAQVPTSISHLGDIAEMLKLPKEQTLFRPQTVTVPQIREADGTNWKLQREADVLLLGDSFSNIFSLGGMGWGEAGGLAENLAFYLRRPVDKIVINAGGAFSSRRELQAQLTRGDDRLATKKVVIWEFSMRDLSQGDWKLLKLPVPPAKPKPTVEPTPTPTPTGPKPGPKPGPGETPPKPTTEPGGKPSPANPDHKPHEGTVKPAAGLTVTGRIAARSILPTGTVYKDCLIALHLTDLKVTGGKVNGNDILVYVWGMRDNKKVDDAYRNGQTITLVLTPWGTAEATYGGYNRQELDDDNALLWDAFWGEEKK